MRAELDCIRSSTSLLARRRVRQPRERVGTHVHFGDGTSASVYRETVIEGAVPQHPCALVVAFRLVGVRGHAHRLFRWESLLNTPLFVGFAGFVSKLWLANDERGVYRGLYDWDGAALAEHYARTLWRVLGLVSAPSSIRYRVLPDTRRDTLLDDAEVFGPRTTADSSLWWRPVSVT